MTGNRPHTTMPHSPMTSHAAEQPPDDELLARFVAGRDQRAFATLVARHGPMVKGTAWRILRSEHDAEDACQATFLALAAAAERLRRRTALVAWLHQTAMRTAKAMARANARWNRNVQGKAADTDESYVPARHDELREVLDEALRRLSPRHRAAVLLCDLEGLSRREAAQRLGVPLSTVCSLVARGRRSLARRLTKTGVTMSAAGLTATLTKTEWGRATELSTETIQTTTSSALRFAAGRSAAEIGVSTAITTAAQGVLTAMTMTKFSMTAAAALAIVLGAITVDGLSGILSSLAKAETIFFDDFDDRDFSDGSPVRWVPVTAFLGSYDASSGDFILHPFDQPPGIAAVAGVPQYMLRDVSIRAQARILEPSGLGGGVELIARADRDRFDVAYLAGLDEAGVAHITRAGSNVTPFATVNTDLRPLEEDVLLQFDVFGSTLDFWAWRPGEQRPADPLLSVTNSDISQPGEIGINYYADPPHSQLGRAVFRYVHVADTSIPEPSTAMLSAIFFAGVFAWHWRRWR